MLKSVIIKIVRQDDDGSVKTLILIQNGRSKVFNASACGDSATGKTALVDMICEYFENGNAGGIDLVCDKECTVLDGRTWKGQLSDMKDCIVFIDERMEKIELR